MNRSTAKNLVLRFSVFTIMSIIIMGTGILLYLVGPQPYIYEDGDWDDYRYIPKYNTSEGNVLVSTHTHTTQSNGVLTPNQTIQWHMAMGYNACVITDSLDPIYPSPWPSAIEARNIARQIYNDSIKILIGIEYHTSRIHLTLILPPDAEDYEDLFTHHKKPTNEQIEEFITIAHSIDAIVIAAHLPYTYEASSSAPTRQELLEMGIDYIEVIDDDNYDRVSEAFCDENGLGKVATPAMHSPLAPVIGWTLINASDFSEQSIFNELKNKRTSIIIEPPAPYEVEHKESLAYKFLRPLIQVGDLLEDYNPTGGNNDMVATGFLILNLAIVFLVGEILRWILVKLYRFLKTFMNKKASIEDTE